MPAVRDSGCVDVLRALVAQGDLSSGRGLVPGCRLADADRAFGTQTEDGAGQLSSVDRRWRKYRLGGDTVARVWIGPADEILLIDIAHPVVRDAPEVLRERLGEPTTTREARHNPTHEDWVHVDRGLTITVGGKYDDPPALRVSYLFVYEPTTLDDYDARLGGRDAWVIRRPMRR